MIAKVVRGWRPAGVLRYLFGPGHAEEHRDPRVVASWDGEPRLHQPLPLPDVHLDGETVAAGPFDFDLRDLTAALEQPARRAGLPLSAPPRPTREWEQRLRSGRPLPDQALPMVRHYRRHPDTGEGVLRPGYVWHCSGRLHPDDPVLPDTRWAEIAQRLTTATGIHQAGCRWIAVRHADDHIHLVAILVDDHGRRFHPRLDYLALRRECRRLEDELGLVATAPADRTAPRYPTRAELVKAARTGRAVTAREELRRVVAGCAAATRGPAGFLRALREEGVDPKLVRHSDGRIRGYTVALPRDLTPAGERVRYSGSRLARDLSWPCLARRWTTTPPVDPLPRTTAGRVPPVVRRQVLAENTALVTAAAHRLRSGRDHDVDGLAHATGELLATLARTREGRDDGPWHHIAARFDRAARTPYRVVPTYPGRAAFELRRASRRIAALGTLHGRLTERAALAALALALAGLIAEIAACHRARARPHQATAAAATAQRLHQQHPHEPRPSAPGGARHQPLPHQRPRPARGTAMPFQLPEPGVRRQGRRV